MNAEDLANALQTVLDDKKAQDIVLVDLRGRATFTDFFLIATGTSRTHVGALAEEVDRFASVERLSLRGLEGMPEAEWVLVDLGDVVVHLFQREHREFYNLEKLWSPKTRALAESDGRTAVEATARARARAG